MIKNILIKFNRLCVALICISMILSFFWTDEVQAGYPGDVTTIIYENGYFKAKNNQSGAMNMYIMNYRLLGEDTVVMITYVSGKGEVDSYYVVADEKNRDLYSPSIVATNRLLTVYPDGGQITFTVKKGSLAVTWPSSNEDMPFSCDYGQKNGSDDSGNESEEEQDEESEENKINLGLLEQMELNGLIKDGKLVLYDSILTEDIADIGTSPTNVVNAFRDFFAKGYVLESDKLPVVTAQKQEGDKILWKIAFPGESDDKSSFENLLEDTTAWDNYKNKVDLMAKTVRDYKDVVDDGMSLNSPIDLGLRIGGTTIKNNEKLLGEFLNPDLSIAGYIEIVTDNELNILSLDGQTAFSLDANSKQHVRQYISNFGVLILPWFWSLQYDCSGTGVIGYSSEAGSLKKVTEGNTYSSISAKANLQGQAGVGIYGCINVQGDMDLDINSEIFPNSVMKVNGSMEMSARFLNYYRKNLVGPYEFNYKIWEHNLEDNLEDKEDPIELCMSMSPDQMIENESKTELVSRDFLQNTSAWNGGADSNNKEDSILCMYAANDNEMSLDGLGTEGKVLQSSTFEGSDPQIISYGDKQVMVFRTLKEQGAVNDAGTLMYSVKKDGIWSEPKQVWNHEGADYYSQMKQIGNDLFLTWQKAASTVEGKNADEQLLDALAGTEICVARFDNEKDEFVNQKYITDNKYMDILPQWVENTSQPSVAWISNEHNDLTGTNYKSIMNVCSLIDGNWSEKKVISEINGYVGNYVAYIDNENFKNIYSSIDMGEYTDEEGVKSKVYAGCENGQQVLEEDATSVLGMTFCDGKGYWSKDGKLMQWNVDTDKVKCLFDGESESKAIGGNFKVIKGKNNKTSVVWIAAKEDGYAAYSSLLKNNELTNPLDLFERKEGKIVSYDVQLLEDGSYDFVMNEFLENDNTYGISEITKAEVENVVLEMVDLEDANRNSSGLQNLSFTIRNCGEKDVSGINLKISTDEKVYRDEKISIDLEAGKSANIKGSFLIAGDVSKPTKFKVAVWPQNQNETTADCYETYLGYTDMELSLQKKLVNDKVRIACNIANISNTTSKGNIFIHYMDENNEVVKKLPVGSVHGQQRELVFFYVDRDMLGSDNSKTFRVEVESEYDECRLNNNSAFISVYKSDFGDNEEESETGTGGGGGTETPAPGGGTETPAPGGGTETPAPGGGTETPAPGGGTETPAPGGGTETPAPGGGTETPAPGGGTKPPAPGNESGGGNPAPGTNNVVKVSEIRILCESTKIAAGKSVKLTAQTAPENASVQAVMWKTSNKAYATVDKNGKVITKKAGAGKTVTITATAKDGSGKKATCKIKILKHAVKSITLKGEKSVRTGKILKLKATVKTTGKTANKVLKWSSSNTKYATVDKKGKVVTQKAGKGKTVTIKAESTDGTGKVATIKIKIK
ncbi:MAG: Ig-like domain-containing protein [Lachnospira sp.]|nr:Ig-like domain-containing protein [Lachnospira sp.]